MKKRLITSEVGSMMIEALAMLALIAAITPILYRKTAERTTELQDINSAGEIRSIIKAVDDYVSANFDAISKGETVDTSCSGANASFDYESLKDQPDAHVKVPLGHFCEFLPYGILDSSGNAKSSRLFSSNYQVVLKVKGDGEANGNRVVTSFVVTEPNMEMREMRSSSIASMIGGNGGYVTEGSTGSGEDASGGKIAGNLGIWGIDDAREELGVSVKKGAIVAASIQGISSQNVKINVDGVLYRTAQPDQSLNTMSTTLYMGATGSTERNSIVNIKDLIVGGETEGANNTVYIDPTKIQVKSDLGGDTTLSPGFLNLSGVTLSGLLLDPDVGRLLTISSPTKINGGLDVNASATVKDHLTVTNGTLQVQDIFYAGVDSADAGFIIGANLATVKMPLIVGVNGQHCTSANWDECSLNVKGDAHIGGDLTVDNSFSAKNLHAQEKLSVGDSDKGLDLTYTPSTSKSTLNFGNGYITAESSGANDGKGVFDIGNSVFEVDTKNTYKTVTINSDKYYLNTPDAYIGGSSGSISMQVGDEYEPAAYMYMNTPGEFYATSRQDMGITSYMNLGIEAPNTAIRANTVTLGTSSLGESVDTVTINADANLKIKDSSSGHNITVENIPTYMSGASANLTMTGGADIIVQKADDETKNIIRMGSDKFTTPSTMSQPQIDIASEGIFANDTNNQKVLKIDLTAEGDQEDEHSVYIRKGAIRIHDTDSSNGGLAYVQTDRFKSHTQLETLALPSNSAGSSEYEVNPAYTSIMHDIKLVSRGGARLSDILPDFINKGIYLVDNTYPAYGYKCNTANGDQQGRPLDSYMGLSKENKEQIKTCQYVSDYVSPWAGFVPTPTCPPGYSKVITVTPASFDIAQAGILNGKDIVFSEFKPVDSEPAPQPLYHQKNTWLKSFANANGSDDSFVGWDVGMGYVYPEFKFSGDISDLEGLGTGNPDETSEEVEGGDEEVVIWNLFPVYAGTLEGYATVYCYFNRKYDGWDPELVDTTYDQLENFRAVNSKEKTDANYLKRLQGGDNLLYDVW